MNIAEKNLLAAAASSRPIDRYEFALEDSFARARRRHRLLRLAAAALTVATALIAVTIMSVLDAASR